MSGVTCARLWATDPSRWRAAAVAWRAWATTAGQWSAEFGRHAAGLRNVWSGAAANAAAARLAALLTALKFFQLLCWEVDQALSEFAAALARAKTLLAQATAAGRAAETTNGDRGGASIALVAGALEVAAAADTTASGRLAAVAAAATAPGAPPPPSSPLPTCTATPAEVKRWWDMLTTEQRRWLVATEPGWLGPLDGIPVGFRDLANRLLLDDRHADLDRAAADARGCDLKRVRDLRRGLDRLADRLADEDGPRAYLLRLDLAEDGRAVVALGDPDHADNVLTQVPGMTADLASYRGELARAERVAVRAAGRGPEAATSAVMWLDYDAPDFVDEAAGASRAEAGAAGLRRFQDGLRATHEGKPAHQTVLGHSYGSLVVGTAARTPGLAADSVVFVGSPGVGVDSAAHLRVPSGQVWSTTSVSDVIQYTAVSPHSLVKDVALAQAVPVAGLVIAFGGPEDDLWFGRNPNDSAFGAHIFKSQPDGGHLGYWDVGRPALDGITDITLGKTRW